MPSTYTNLSTNNERNDYVKFSAIPQVQEAISAASIGVVTVNHTNNWFVDGKYFEQYNTVATSVVAPSFSSLVNNGLNVAALTAANAKQIEITQGNSIAIKNCFLTRTSPAFFVRATFNISTLNTVAEVSVGFRKQQTYSATPIISYTDLATIGVSGAAGHIQTRTGIASAYVLTDTTNTATAGTNFTVQVNIDGSGNVTYLWGNANGVLAAPTTVVAAQMGTGLNFIPWINIQMAAGANGEVDLVDYACGLL